MRGDYYSPENRQARMSDYQRQGIGLVLGFDGHWHADHLEGLERAQVELLVNAESALTHDACPAGGSPAGAKAFTVSPCRSCGQGVVVNSRGLVMPHTVAKELLP
jgi:hypothetical protein